MAQVSRAAKSLVESETDEREREQVKEKKGWPGKQNKTKMLLYMQPILISNLREEKSMY
jgi:hypothetical protein